MQINGDAWAAVFLASEPDYTVAGWIDAYKKTFSGCKPDLTPGQITEAAHLAFAREGMWNNPKIAAGMTNPAPIRLADNGVNVDALLSARAALTDAPEGARFKWRATSEWVKGTHNRATVDGFFGLGAEQQHRQTYKFESDHPEIFASEDKGATPVEFVLVGLAGCLTAGIAAVAQNRNIQLHSVKATLEAGMNIQGILGIDPDVRNGFDGIKVHYDIDADASAEDIAALVAQSQKRSAVYDIITNPTNVTVEVA